MKLFHQSFGAESILRFGFRDGAVDEGRPQRRRGVLLRSIPFVVETTIPQGLLEVHLPDALAAAHECSSDTDHREFIVPAAVLNAYGPPRLVGHDEQAVLAGSATTEARAAERLVSFMTDLQHEVNRTEHLHETNSHWGLRTYPVPFFGDPLTAEALTVGVNPSADEFRGDRWPSTMDGRAMVDRLRRYFQNSQVPPHPWFEHWSAVLRPLGYEYSRNAAHTDLSPRATVSMSAVRDHEAFSQMLESDVVWLFRLLPLCPWLRVMFIAGASSKREYLFEFFKRVAPRSGCELEADAYATTDRRRQASRFFRLRTPVGVLPVFFVSNSPSSRNPRAMREAFEAASGALRNRGFAAAPPP